MASEADIDVWDIDIDQSIVTGHLDAWTLAGYTWDPVALVATRKADQVELCPSHAHSAGGRLSADDDSGGSHVNPGDPEMDVDTHEGGRGGDVVDPEMLASASIYHLQPAGSKLMICQVAGCGLSLEGMKGYFLRHRVCEEHSKSPVLMIGSVPSRLCQQCSKFHHVSAFEGSKRTCRIQLDRIRINKRIRRNRKMNQAASVAYAAAAGFLDDGAMLGEVPARPASVYGGVGRMKRPADSSGSGDGSWVVSRKSSRHGGTVVARSGRGGSGAIIDAQTAAAEDVPATDMGAKTFAEPAEFLPASGASDSGSREHPRASLGASGPLPWSQCGPQNSVPPLSPPSAAAVAVAAAAVVNVRGEAGSFTRSPSSAVTGGSRSAGAGVDSGSMQHSGLSQPPLVTNRVARLDSLPVSVTGVDEGGPGSIAAAAAGLVNDTGLLASLRRQLLPECQDIDLTSFVAQQDAVVAALAAAQVHHLSATDVYGSGILGGGLIAGAQQQQQQLAVGIASCGIQAAVTAVAEGFQQPLSGQDSGGSNSNGNGSVPEELKSVRSMTWAASDADAAMVTAAGGAPLHPPSIPALLSSGLSARSAPAAPTVHLSASSLHPLLQKQLQQELLLHHHKIQLQQHGTLGNNSLDMQLLEQQQHERMFPVGVELLRGPSVEGSSAGSPADAAQQQIVDALFHNPQQQLGSAAHPWGVAIGEGPVHLRGSSYLEEPALLAASGTATATATSGGPTVEALARAATVTAQPAVVGQLSGPCSATVRMAPAGVRVAPRSCSQCDGGGETDGDIRGGSGGPGTSLPSGVTTTLSSSKLVRMSLENDDALDSGVLGNLLELLQAHNAEPRGAGLDLRVCLASHLAPSTFSEPCSHGSGNCSLAMSAAAAANVDSIVAGNALGVGASGMAGGMALCGVGSTADLSQAAALSRAGSGAVGSPQNAAMMMTAAAAGTSRLDALGFAAASGEILSSTAGIAGGGRSLPVSIPDVGGLAGSRLLERLGGLIHENAGLTVNPAAAAAAAAPASHLLLQQELLMAQQQQQQVQAHMQVQQQVHLQRMQHQAQQQQAQQHQAQQQQAQQHQAQQQQAQQQQAQQQQAQLQLLQQQQHLLRLQHAQAQQQALMQTQAQMQAQMQIHAQQQAGFMQGAAVATTPSVPAAGLLLSRLLDADTKTHHLSSELNGCLAEKQFLRRQLLATLSSCQGPDAEQLAAAAMAAAGSTHTGGAAAASVDEPHELQPAPSMMLSRGPHQLNLQRPLMGSLGAAGAGLGLEGTIGSGLGCFSSSTLPLMDVTSSHETAGLGVRPGGALAGLIPRATASTMAISGLEVHHQQQLLQMGSSAVGRMGMSGLGTGLRPLPSGLGAGGLLSTGRPSAVAQLQALSEARVAAAGGGSSSGGSGVSSSAGYGAPDLLTRVSLKIMHCLPDELPSDIRSRMQAFASQAPLDLVQGCLRPGCTEVVLDALHCGCESQLVTQLLREGDAAAAAEALRAALPSHLATKDIYLQAGDRALCLRQGAPARHISWEGVGVRRGDRAVSKPVLVAAELLVMHLDGDDMENCVRMRVYGKHLTDPGVTVLARMAGLALEVRITKVSEAPHAAEAADDDNDATSAATAISNTASETNTPQSASSVSPPPLPHGTASDGGGAAATSMNPHLYDVFDVEVQLPCNAPPQGLLILEPRLGVLLGKWAPVLLLEEEESAVEMAHALRSLSADEGRRLAVAVGMFVDHAERGAAALEAWEEGEEGGRQHLAMEEEEEQLWRRRRPAELSCGSGSEVDDESEGDMCGAVFRADVHPGTESDSVPGSGSGSGPSWGELKFGAAHQRVVRLGHTLLAYSALRGYPSLMSYIGAQLVEMGEPLAALLSASYNGAELLSCAVLSGSCPVMNITAAWATKSGVVVNWRAQVVGQPQGVNLLHLAGSLPLPLAVHALNSLWGLATSATQPPAATDAFAAAWFADPYGISSDFDPPAALFHAAVNVAAILAAIHPPAAAPALSGILAAENLDRFCLLRLASSYIRTHNYTSPLDHVELPSTEVNSCVALSLSSGTGKERITARGVTPSSQRLHKADDDDSDDDLSVVQDLVLGGGNAVVALRYSRSCGTEALVHTTGCGGPDRGGRADTKHRSGCGSVDGSTGTYEPLAAHAAAETSGWAAALAMSSSSKDLMAPPLLLEQRHPPPPPPPAQPQQLAANKGPLAAVASPLRMKVSVAPKAIAQTAAAAAARQQPRAETNEHPDSSSWLAGGSSGADASCVPPSGTTNATTTMFASGSLPAFASFMTAGAPYSSSAGAPYGSLTASYYSQAAAWAAQGAGSGKPSIPMHPLMDMFQPLPESPPSGLQDKSGGTSFTAAAGTEAAAAGWGQGLGPKPQPPPCGDSFTNVDATATSGGWGRMQGSSVSVSDYLQGGATTGEAGPPTAAAAGVATAASTAEPGPDKLLGQMRGLARMFKRLFKKGRAAAEAGVAEAIVE